MLEQKRVHVLLVRLQLKKKKIRVLCALKEREPERKREVWDRRQGAGDVKTAAEWSDTLPAKEHQGFQRATRSWVRGMAWGVRFSCRVSEGTDPADTLPSDFRSPENTLPPFSASQLVVICYGSPRQQIQALYYSFHDRMFWNGAYGQGGVN